MKSITRTPELSKGVYYPSPLMPAWNPTDEPHFSSGGVNITPIWASYRDDVGWCMLGRASNDRRYFSQDKGETWTLVGEANFMNGRNSINIVTRNPDINKSILLIQDPDNDPDGAKVFMSSDINSALETSYDEVLHMDSGYPTRIFSWYVWDNIILLSGYGGYDIDNRFVYISQDYGETWKKSEVVAVGDVINDEALHGHGIAFDPITSRIWMSMGDRENAQIYYSDDFGDSWESVHEPNAVVQHSTPIFSFPDRIVFGNDGRPDGMRVYYRNLYEQREDVQTDKILPLFVMDKFVTTEMQSFSLCSQVEPRTMLDGFPYNYISPSQPRARSGRLFATGDGEHWFPIWDAATRPDWFGNGGENDMSIHDTVGPVPDENGDLVIYISGFSSVKSSLFFVKLKMPEWIRL